MSARDVLGALLFMALYFGTEALASLVAGMF